MADMTADQFGAETPDTKLTTADGKPLKAALARAERRAKLRAAALVLPLLLFVLLTFVAPIGQMLFRSVHNDGFSAHMPNLVAWFQANEAGTEPDEAAYEALVLDLRGAREAKT
ncbi:MAG: ABC transporter permease, partial [Pseudomonadota bacterium]